MPTYSYACTVCDHRFDAVQKFSDDSLTVCPECQGRLRKVFNSVGVVFKGSGFYRTDSRSGSGKSASDSLTSASGSSSEGGTGKDSGASKDGGASKDSGAAASTSAAKTSTSSSSTAAS